MLNYTQLRLSFAPLIIASILMANLWVITHLKQYNTASADTTEHFIIPNDTVSPTNETSLYTNLSNIINLLTHHPIKEAPTESSLTFTLKKLGYSIIIVCISMGFLYLSACTLGLYKVYHHQKAISHTIHRLLLLTTIIPKSLMCVFLANFYYYFHAPMIDQLTRPFSLTNIPYYCFVWSSYHCLPIIAIVLPRVLPLSLLVESICLQELSKPYANTAKILGLNPKDILTRHVWPNIKTSLINTIPNMFIKILFSSAIIVEILFSLDGIGYLAYQAMLMGDFSLITTISICYSIISICLYTISDIATSYLNPQIKLAGSHVS